MVAGLEEITDGELYIGDKDVYKRQAVYVEARSAFALRGARRGAALCDQPVSYTHLAQKRTARSTAAWRPIRPPTRAATENAVPSSCNHYTCERARFQGIFTGKSGFFA